MLVSMKWLRDFVDVDCDVDSFAEKMTMSGSKVETIEYIGESIKKVVVGRILDIVPHPDADKLIITSIDIGESEPLQIVTGANNVKVNDYIPVALHGSVLADGTKIKKGKLRGVASNGMLCSLEELGIEKKYIPEHLRDGIYLLNENLNTPFVLGQDIREVLQLTDAVIEFEITANRPDCQSVIGIAREAAATLDVPFQSQTIALKESEEQISYDCKVEDEASCPRFMIKEIKNVTIGPSPYAIQRRLIESGIRPINNIVDITNYVMLEYGQPMHAYDVTKLESSSIVVRLAEEGDTFVTLDDSERTLDASMLMITNNNKNIGIAGVMGGQNTEIDASTTHILLESANFDADSIRRTSKTLGLRTEASSRFEKGIDRQRCEKALKRACQLIEEWGCGTVCQGVSDTQVQAMEAQTISVSLSHINATIGIDLNEEQFVALLARLEIKAEKTDHDYLLTIPLYRSDLWKEEDIVEEVARLYGYDRVPSQGIIGEVLSATKSDQRRFEDEVKQLSTGLGFYEITTYSFVGPSDIERSMISTDKQILTLLNPLGEETSVMRPSLIPGMLNTIALNDARKNKSAALFEYGNVFQRKERDGKLDAIEEKEYVAAVYGEEEDFYTLKGRVELFLNTLGITNLNFVPETDFSDLISNHEDILKNEQQNDVPIEYRLDVVTPFLHPGRSAKLIVQDRVIGVMGELHPNTMKRYDLKHRVAIVQLDMETIYSIHDTTVKFESLNKYPEVERDLAILVDESIYVQQIEDLIRKHGTDLLSEVRLFDVYAGDQIEKGKKSVAYALKYRSHDRTLTDQEVNAVQDSILATLESQLNAQLR